MEREYELQTHEVEDRHWWYQGRRRVLEHAIALLRLPVGASILDAGCGSGRNMVELAHRGEIVGVELSEAWNACAVPWKEPSSVIPPSSVKSRIIALTPSTIWRRC